MLAIIVFPFTCFHPSTNFESVGCPLVELEDKAIKDKVESTRDEKGKLDKVRVGNDKVERDKVDPTETPKAKGQSRRELTKIIDLKHGEDDQTSPKSYTRSEASHKTPEEGLSNSNRSTEPTEVVEPTLSAHRRSRRPQRPTEFYQPGFDYVNYKDAGKPSSY